MPHVNCILTPKETLVRRTLRKIIYQKEHASQRKKLTSYIKVYNDNSIKCMSKRRVKMAVKVHRFKLKLDQNKEDVKNQLG